MGVDNVVKNNVGSLTTRIQPGQQAPITQIPVQSIDQPVKSSVQMNMEGFLRSKLTELAKAIVQRAGQLESLPADIKAIVQDILQSTPEAADILPQGMSALLKNQSSISEQLYDLGETLKNSALLNQATDSDLQTFLSKVALAFADNSSVSPEAAAKQLLNLVNELMVSSGAEGELPADQAEAITNFVTKLTSGNQTDLTETEQKLLTQLTQQFVETITDNVQQLAKLVQMQSDLGVGGNSAANSKLEQTMTNLLNTLPPEIRQVIAEYLQTGNMSEEINNLAQTLEEAALLNANTPKELRDVLTQTAGKFAAWSPVPPGQAAEEMVKLAATLLTDSPEAGEIKTMLQRLAAQLPAMQTENLSDQEKTQLEFLFKNMETKMPEQLLAAAKAQELPELPKLWSLFKAAAAGEWQNISPKLMEQATVLMKNLAATAAGKTNGIYVLGNQAELLAQLPVAVSDIIRNNLGKPGADMKELAAFLQQAGTEGFAAESSAGQTTGLNKSAWLQQVLTENKDALLTAFPVDSAQSQEKVQGKSLIAAGGVLQELAQGLEQSSQTGRTLLSQELALSKLSPEINEIVQNIIKNNNPSAKLQSFTKAMAGISGEEIAGLADFRQLLAQATAAQNGGGGLKTALSSNFLQIMQQYVQENVPTVNEMKTMLQSLSTQLLGGSSSALPIAEQKILQQLVQNLGSNLPLTITQATRKANTPELAEVYSLLKAIETGQWRGGQAEILQKAADIIKEMAQSLQKPTGLVSQKLTEHSILSFSTPLYFGDGTTMYPAYIHVYQQEQQESKGRPVGGRSAKYETWLRVSLETENLGVVDTIFRLYDEDQLSVRVRISGVEAAEALSDCAIDIRKKLHEGVLNLTEFNINAV